MTRQPPGVVTSTTALVVDIPSWPVKTPTPELLTRGVHVWRVDLNIPDPAVKQVAVVLDHTELDRARRFRFEEDRRRYIASHAALRVLLAQLTGIAAAAVTFGLGRHGKPYLRGAALVGDVRFNMAHSHDLALIAVAGRHEVGVDVERLRSMSDALNVAARFFSPQEVADLRTVAGTTLESRAFFNCWTRKEAVVKALGDGLSYPLDSFSVTLLPGQSAEISWDASLGAGLTGWSLIDLNPASDFAAALAISAHPVPVKGWSFCWDNHG